MSKGKEHSGWMLALVIVVGLVLMVLAVLGAAAAGPGKNAVGTWWRYVTRKITGDARTAYDEAADQAYSAGASN